MNNRFQELAERFLSIYQGEEGDELDYRIRRFLSNQGIDEAWMEEAVEVVTEAVEDNA